MLNPLIFSIGLIVVLVLIIFIYYSCSQCGKNLFSISFLLFLTLIITLSGAVYWQIGRFDEWQVAQVDRDQDPQLAAKITEVRHFLQANPTDAVQRRKLIALYMEAGDFDESIKAIDFLLQGNGTDSALQSLKARALYYRDGRVLTPEVQAQVDRVLRLNSNEPSVKMLLAENAYRNKNYEQAINYWTSVLEKGHAASQEKLIRTAIANAKKKLNELKSSKLPSKGIGE